MLPWLTTIQLVVAVLAALLCLLWALRKQPPGDLTFLSLGLVWVGLWVQLVVSLLLPGLGSPARGSYLEFWLYLGSALLVPPSAAVFAFFERSRWGNLVMALAAAALAVMLYRMQVIWG